MIKAVVTWKNPISRSRFRIGELIFHSGMYYFEYDKNINIAIKHGFDHLGEFDSLDKKYESEELFMTFLTRLPNKKRKDFKKFLLENEIDENSNDLEILFATRGFLATDTIEVFKDIDFNQNNIFLFLVGTKYYINNNLELNKGAELFLVKEPDNKFDKFAVYAKDKNDIKLGYIPNIFSESMVKWISDNKVHAVINKVLKLDNNNRVEIELKITKK